MDETAALTELARRLREAIAAADGVLPFAEFMRRSLYEPGLGYYERSARTVGRAGDFYTSVSVGSVFGELLAFQFAAWLETVAPDASGHWQIVEAGAHDGRLAADLLGWLHRCRPALAGRITYVIMEPSPSRREWQAATLAPWAAQVTWASAVPPTHGIIFGNELLDAFPVRRLGWDASTGDWFEWGVGLADEEFVWRRRSGPVTPSDVPPALPAEVRAVLPDGFTTEVSPAAEAWWRTAAGSLTAGWLAAFDYGLEEAEFFVPQRARGTLRGYRSHRPADDLLAAPGATDLTAHVNFSRMAAAGEAAGLRPGSLTGQGIFLTRIMARTLDPAAGFGDWTAPRVRQFQTLTHPEHLGRSFRVLVQAAPDGPRKG